MRVGPVITKPEAKWILRDPGCYSERHDGSKGEAAYGIRRVRVPRPRRRRKTGTRVTASATELRLWNTSLGQQLAVRTREQRVPLEEARESFVRFRDEVCARIGRNLTNAERRRYLANAAEMSPVCRESD